MEMLQWTVEDALACINCLKPEDFCNAQWCQDKWGNWHACDSYAIRYDDTNKKRIRNTYLSYYIKFSIKDGDRISLILVSCHVSS